VLFGVISTVSFDLSSNGLAPLSAVQVLLQNPGEYTHVPAETADVTTRAPTVRW
jgi:hypothetical protein